MVSYQRLVCGRQVIQHAALEVTTHGHKEVCGKPLLLCAQLVSQLCVIQHGACMVEAQRQQPSSSRYVYMPLPQCKDVPEDGPATAVPKARRSRLQWVLQCSDKATGQASAAQCCVHAARSPPMTAWCAVQHLPAKRCTFSSRALRYAFSR